MNGALLLVGSVILLYILFKRFLARLLVPSLLIFIALGICFGENGLLRIVFNDYQAVNVICSTCLIFIMFYGGFGTNIKAARPVLAQATVLSTLGVAGTAGAVGLFAHFALSLPWAESMLIGSVIASTDAASVFNVLRSQKLALKDHTDSLLELESGSNDPISYMLTTATLAILAGQQFSFPALLVRQLCLGALCGLAMGALAAWLLRQNLLTTQHSRTIFLFAVMLLAYALPTAVNGNGYLSVYLCGIWLGNTSLTQKKYLVHFFNVITDVAQVLIFFLLGLLVTPVELPAVLLPAVGIMVFLTLVARPAVTALLLAPFRPSLGQVGIVSWAGLRGAASIVFAISAVLSGAQTRYDLYNLVFCIVLLSISIQGTLLPWIARRLSMIDKNADVRKTFNDYQEESDISFVKIHLGTGHPWCGLPLCRLALPGDLLVVMIAREGDTILPGGDTILQPGDLLVLAARSFEDRENLCLREVAIDRSHKWAGQPLSQIPFARRQLVIMVRRGLDTMIPDGSTVLLPGDVVVLAETETAPAAV
ncbi:MAG TPA: potassium/proton antiporter [Candidatus Anaerofilum excrementigallinarum]|nr:potassium/proton antiporter [Candidatus Anaerofilum excrementigallinarum]